MNAVIFGAKSDIGVGLHNHLLADGWNVWPWARGDRVPATEWNLCIITIGRIAPVGLWHTNEQVDWLETIMSNLVAPVRLLREIWPYHGHNPAVCFFAGSNPQTIMDGYSAYNASKMGLLKAVEQLDHETPDARMFALGPGIVLTKIHKPTLDAGWENQKLLAAQHKLTEYDYGAQIRRIYDCIMWAIKQPKDVIGGRNLCVSDPWDSGWLSEYLRRNPTTYKLRRVEP